MHISKEQSVQAEEIAIAGAFWWEHVWHFQGTAKKSVRDGGREWWEMRSEGGRRRRKADQKGFVGNYKDLDFYFQWNEDTLRSSEQRHNMTGFYFKRITVAAVWRIGCREKKTGVETSQTISIINKGRTRKCIWWGWYARNGEQCLYFGSRLKTVLQNLLVDWWWYMKERSIFSYWRNWKSWINRQERHGWMKFESENQKFNCRHIMCQIYVDTIRCQTSNWRAIGLKIHIWESLAYRWHLSLSE